MLKSAHALGKGQICQSSHTPKLKMLVRDSCGGREKIDDAFCAQFEYIDFAVDNSQAVLEPGSTEAALELQPL